MRHRPVLPRPPAVAPPAPTTRTHSRVWRGWLLAWLGMVVAALVNGTLRALVTQPLFGETVARQLATVVLLALLFGYQWWLSTRLPLPTTRVALAVGATWAALTLGFEFGFGRYVEHLSWSTMLADYDVTAGRLWVLVPLWLVVGPVTIRALQRRGAADARR